MAAADIIKGKSRWTTYEGEMNIATLVGGIPKDTETMKKFLKAKLDVGDVQLLQIFQETLLEMGYDKETATSADLDDAMDKLMAEQAKGNGFKSVDGQLVWETRCLFAAIKEAANVLYPGQTPWPNHPGAKVTRKGFEGWLKERIQVVGEGRGNLYLFLGRSEADVKDDLRLEAPDIAGEERIKHVSTPQGQRSIITIVDVCEDVKIKFQVKVLDDFIEPQTWLEIWEYVEGHGVGADRGRSDGHCEVVHWKRV